ncbi:MULTISPECIES: glutamate-cysteine ligase family protein [unclassified Streptomyces]|uniref:glutamate-cysteine ligase family protein n=2 Tax=unclassified Streptomyces TaxID=2593676 RepID=UPI0037F131FB
MPPRPIRSSSRYRLWISLVSAISRSRPRRYACFRALPGPSSMASRLRGSYGVGRLPGPSRAIACGMCPRRAPGRRPPCCTWCLPLGGARRRRARAGTDTSHGHEDPAARLPAPVTEEPRCPEQVCDYRGPVDEHVICAAHVRVGVPDRKRAVLVSNHPRRRLPHLIALSANPRSSGGVTRGKRAGAA